MAELEAATTPIVKPTNSAAVTAATARKIFIFSDIKRESLFNGKLGFRQTTNRRRPRNIVGFRVSIYPPVKVYRH
ncbi:hypothetical protein [Bifidobacterium catenulatum]|uniref:hypothetical protein n=1 Tax=Bifidobacterium catenulatum TaxID=1686 RepID=UPI0010081FEB|nr:hypothetical protein [Bifidobacterium catenulatum]MDH7870335.1 hypothetical protein [Bifidobacterium catenulatum subsp. kashiwanohense]